MTGRLTQSSAWFSWVMALSITGVAATGVEKPTAPVRVTVWEGLPKAWDWRTPSGAPADRFDWPALGFVRLPVKYSARGIALDRSGPFVVRAEAVLHEPRGTYRLILRGRGASRLLVDGRTVAETKGVNPNSAGHEDVPDAALPDDPRWRPVATGDQERVTVWESDGTPHRVELWAVIGDKGLRQETGELSVSVAAPGGLPVVLGSGGRLALTDAGWTGFVASETVRLDALDTARRRVAARSDDAYWEVRHEVARREALKGTRHDPAGKGNLVDRVLGADAGPVVDDAGFFRRLSLDTTGVIPDAGEVEAFLADPRPDKRERAVDARLADPRWADAWVGYWQDVLAENPGILKPTLNNTGPFRTFLYTSFLDNTAADRFATDLIRMEGSALGGGPAGFGIASQNDAPMAAKAQVVAKAFLAAEMKCARCHDAPFHPYDQADLFGLAGMLAGKPQAVPATSTVPRQEGGRAPAVSVTLSAGETVEPHWNLGAIRDAAVPEDLLPAGPTSRDRLALLVTAPANTRFAPVLVNRLWARYFGKGLVTPVDDWDNRPKARNAPLLDALARELLAHDYDLKHVARLIFLSRAYQADGRSVGPTSIRARRRMSAEQVVDSLFAAVGKPFRAEELNLDPDGRRPPTEFLNLGVPRRAWQFTSTSNERDRPALSLPVTQSLVDVLETFGWRPSRQDPITERDEATTPLQPALLANGVAAARVVRLSDDSAITALCLKDDEAATLIRSVTLRILSRPSTPSETARLIDYLGPTYATRVVPGAKARPNPALTPARRVSWSNHLSPEATKIQLDREQAARAGDPPTDRLTPEFRERMEDVVWALINSPEFVFVP